MTDPKPDPTAKRTWTEEIEVAGDQLVASVKRWAAEGKVRRVRITGLAGITDPSAGTVVSLTTTNSRDHA